MFTSSDINPATTMFALLLSAMLLVGPVMDTTWAYQEEREQMVRTQIENRGIDDPVVLRAMRTVPRHEFAPEHPPERTYQDRPLPIGHGQTISQPFIVAYMTALLQPDASERALEVGTGSGYQAAVLAEIVDTVYTIEIIPELAESAEEKLNRLGYENVVIKTGDGYQGWEAHAPFDIIVVTAAPEEVPPPLIEQLKDGGRMVIPTGPSGGTQMLTLITKEDGEVNTRSLTPVRFVPFQRSEN